MKKIYFNGKIYTGKEKLSTAFAVEDGLFILVGTDDEVLSLRDESTYCIDLKGAFVCPGFNDSHMHLLNFGQTLSMAALSEHTDSLLGMIEYLKDYAKDNPSQKGGWIKGRGWNQDYFSDTDRMPNRYDLDLVSRDYPVIITRACGHCCVVNSKALEIAGIADDSLCSDGGSIGMENGKPDGRFFDNAMDLFDPFIPLPAKDEIKEMLRIAARTLNSYGITSVQTDDYCVFRNVPYEVVNEAYRELEDSGELSVRVYEQSNFNDIDELKRFIESGNITGTGTPMFKIGPLKMLGDGSLGSRTAHLSSPYADMLGTCGFSLFSDENMNEMISYANSHGMQVAVHAIGDACLDQVLNAIEGALKTSSRDDHRHGIVHCQISRKDQLERIARLKLHVYAQSIFLDYDNHIVENRVGKELASTSYSWKSLMEMGVCVSNGSDCPVELPDVLKGIECAVTRTSMDGTGPYLPGEAFTVKEAVDSFTICGARASFEENKKGSIAPGFYADFNILDGNLFDVPQKELHNVIIDACYLSGECVYRRVN